MSNKQVNVQYLIIFYCAKRHFPNIAIALKSSIGLYGLYRPPWLSSIKFLLLRKHNIHCLVKCLFHLIQLATCSLANTLGCFLVVYNYELLMMLSCWRADLKERMMFADMVNTIESILTKVAQYLDFNNFVLTVDTNGKGITDKEPQKQWMDSNVCTNTFLCSTKKFLVCVHKILYKLRAKIAITYCKYSVREQNKSIILCYHDHSPM